MTTIESPRGNVRTLRDYVLEKSFRFLRRFKPVRERVTPGEFNDHVEREHLARYRFARRYCQGKSVADIACGTGYGTKLLGEVALQVDGYDKESLCNNKLIDLERQSWEKSYDVIVSFETIEHLENPEFFVQNVHRTAKLFLVSTPVGEFKGYNPFHKQVWTLDEFKAFIERYFGCEYFFQSAEVIHDQLVSPVRFVVAVCTPKELAHDVATRS